MQARGVRDILAVDVSPAMLAALQQRVGPPSTLGNDACVRTWLGDVTELPSFQARPPRNHGVAYLLCLLQ